MTTIGGASDSTAGDRNPGVYAPGEPVLPETPLSCPEALALRKILADRDLTAPPPELQLNEPHYEPARAIYVLADVKVE
eukprot:7509198-Heterocapsa_arctica.AAC.1